MIPSTCGIGHLNENTYPTRFLNSSQFPRRSNVRANSSSDNIESLAILLGNHTHISNIKTHLGRKADQWTSKRRRGMV